MCPLELACPLLSLLVSGASVSAVISIGRSVLYEFMKRCWWSIASKLFEDWRQYNVFYCLVSENFWDLSCRSRSRLEQKIERLGLARLVNFVGMSRLGLVSNIKSNVSVSSRSRAWRSRSHPWWHFTVMNWNKEIVWDQETIKNRIWFELIYGA